MQRVRPTTKRVKLKATINTEFYHTIAIFVDFFRFRLDLFLKDCQYDSHEN